MLRLCLQHHCMVASFVISEASLSVKQFETGFLAQAYIAIRTQPN